MKIINKSSWENTYDTLHHLSQILGKIKLSSTPLQPEWANVPLEVYPLGFRTGLLYKDGINFEILLNIHDSEVIIYNTASKIKSFKLEGDISVSEIYSKTMELLTYIGLNISINTIPQEMQTKVRFEENTQKIHYDKESAKLSFESVLFAYNELNTFISPFRSKKIMPKFYWGTFDLGTTMFSGNPAPIETKDIITKVGFDEQMIEFGYAFDNTLDGNPYFYILVYPINIHKYENIKLDGHGYFSKEKSEFFLPLSPVLNEENPGKTVQDFLKASFDIICSAEEWPHLEWHTQKIIE